MPKLYPTRLTFPDLQREEFSAKRSEPAEGALLEFVGMNVPVMEIGDKEERKQFSLF